MSQVTSPPKMLGRDRRQAMPAAGENGEGPPAAPRSSVVRILSWVPPILVLTALGAFGYWGHHSGWQFSASAAFSGSEGEPVEWCTEHNVAEADCIACQTSLLPPVEDYGWCHQHGLDPCPLCHPEIIQLSQTPAIPPDELLRVDGALALRDRAENNTGCPLNVRRVQFASMATVEKAGIDVEPVERRRVTEAIETNGEIVYDPTRLAHLSSRVAGTVWRVEKNVGDRVKRGDVLALIDAVEVGRAKAELLDALANVEFHEQTVDRLVPLAKQQIIPGSRLLEAETAFEQARIKLRRAQQALANLGLAVSLAELRELPADARPEYLHYLGLPHQWHDQLQASTATNNLLPLIAPQDGVVIRREIVAGEVVDTQRLLFQLADTQQMWLVFNVAMEDTDYLKLGQTVRFWPDGSRREITSELSWISTDVDPETRTVAVRANLDNADGRLRSETFGVGQIILREDPEAIVVPDDAVQWDGNCHVVFVRDKDYFNESSPKMFHTRAVRPATSDDGFTEIIAGVWPGEVVVTRGSGILRAQILKNNLGAGCTCGH